MNKYKYKCINGAGGGEGGNPHIRAKHLTLENPFLQPSYTPATPRLASISTDLLPKEALGYDCLPVPRPPFTSELLASTPYTN